MQGKVAISEHTHSHQNNIRNGVKMIKGAGRKGDWVVRAKFNGHNKEKWSAIFIVFFG